MTLVKRSVQKIAAILGAGGSRCEPNNKARVVHDENNRSIVTKVMSASGVVEE